MMMVMSLFYVDCYYYSHYYYYFLLLWYWIPMLMMPLFYHYFFLFNHFYFINHYHHHHFMTQSLPEQTDRQTDPDTRHTDPETPDKHEQIQTLLWCDNKLKRPFLSFFYFFFFSFILTACLFFLSFSFFLLLYLSSICSICLNWGLFSSSGKLSLMAEREWLICEAHKWGLPQIALSRQLKGDQHLAISWMCQ